MKKSILLVALILTGSVVFAQSYTYENQAYAQAAEQANRGEKIKQFPADFYFDSACAEQTEKQNDRCNLSLLIKQRYEAYGESFEDAYNYSAALLSVPETGIYFKLPLEQAEQARKILKQMIEVNPNAIETYRLLDLAYEYIIFGQRRSDDYTICSRYYENFETASVQEYAAHQKEAYARLALLEKRIALHDENLSYSDYMEAGLINEAIGRHAMADMYYEMSRNAGCENQD